MSMKSNQNYESQWWGHIYDQMMEQDLPDLLANHRHFYHENLAGIQGPVLECACGSGLFLLPLLNAGFNIFGFDISESMLSQLKPKAQQIGHIEIDQRLSIQSFETFHYDILFEAIIIPTNSFSMVTTQEAQIQTMKNIYQHLAPGGKLLFDLRLTGMRDLVEGTVAGEGSWHDWLHPETGKPIRQKVNGRIDVQNRLIIDECIIEYDGQTESFPMISRWLLKPEIELLLQLAGFKIWEVCSTPNKDPHEESFQETMSYWIATK